MGMSFRALVSVWSVRLVWPNGAIAIYGIVCAPPQTHARGIWGMVFMPQAKKNQKIRTQPSHGAGDGFFALSSRKSL